MMVRASTSKTILMLTSPKAELYNFFGFPCLLGIIKFNLFSFSYWRSKDEVEVESDEEPEGCRR